MLTEQKYVDTNEIKVVVAKQATVASGFPQALSTGSASVVG